MEKNVNQHKGKPNAMFIIVGVLVIASIGLRLIEGVNFEQTSILFIGIPAIMALLIVKYTGSSDSLYGLVFKTITLFLLLASIVFGEGMICILMSAPIFYGVGALVVVIFEFFKYRSNSKIKTYAAIPLLFLLSQPLDYNSKPQLNAIKKTVIVDRIVTSDVFRNSPDLNIDLPLFLTFGFPMPLDVVGSGLNVGDLRDIRFLSSTKGIGTLTLEITNRTKDVIAFKVVNDNTHIAHWLSWKTIIVNFVQLENNRTEVTWTSNFECDLGPTWYFKPIEKYAVKTMNLHLLNTYLN